MFRSTFNVKQVALLLLSLGLVHAADPACDPSDPLTPASICAQRAGFGGSLVVPQVIPSFLPTGLLHVVYGNVDVGAAQQLSPSRVSSTPSLSYDVTPGTSSGPKYLLVMIDSDAGASSSVLHWMQTDLSLGSSGNSLTTSVKPAAQYAGPAPPQGSGTHRYVILLYTQPESFVLPIAYQNMPTTPQTGSARIMFSLPNFLSAAGIGEDPVGGDFFKSTYDGTSGTNSVAPATGAIPGVTGTGGGEMGSSVTTTTPLAAATTTTTASATTTTTTTGTTATTTTTTSGTGAVTTTSSSTSATTTTAAAASNSAVAAGGQFMITWSKLLVTLSVCALVAGRQWV